MGTVQIVCLRYFLAQEIAVYVDGARIGKWLRSLRIDSASLCSLAAGRNDNPICRNGLPDYLGCRNRFLGIDFWAP